MSLPKKKILLTAFKHTSAEKLIKGISEFDTLFLPNDKVLDSQKTIDYISKRKIDCIISIGQRPNIKDKVYIETLASKKMCKINTSFDYENLKMLFEKKGLNVKLSNNAIKAEILSTFNTQSSNIPNGINHSLCFSVPG